MKSFVSHLEGAIDGTRLDINKVQTLHKEKPIWVRYDLDELKKEFKKEYLHERDSTIWRYYEMLPVQKEENIVSLGEGMTPLLPARRLGSAFGITDLWIKDESQLPTGSFKSRGLCLAVSKAKEFVIKRIAIPTAGNAGGALAAYAARAGIEAYVFMPENAPKINQIEAKLAGAKVFLVNGLITDCGKIVKEGKKPMGWFDVSTLKEPYRIEGKKTMGLELAEQFNWKLPDVILYPTGGGTGLIGMWKAFNELREIGWLESDTMPRMVSVQSTGCAPIVRAFEKNERFAEFFEGAETCASGICIPAAVGDFMILDAIRESGGIAVSAKENGIRRWMNMVTSLEGIAFCPEAAVCVGALKSLKDKGVIRDSDRVVIFNTAAGQKYPDVISSNLPRLDKNAPIDWDELKN